MVIASGSVTITLTDSTDKSAAAFVTADGSLNGPQGFTAAITNGAISGLNVPDMCTATNTIPNHPLSALVTITRSVSSTTSNGYSFEIPAGSTAMCGSNPFALDHYSPAQTAAIAPTGLIAVSTPPTHCGSPSLTYLTASPYTVYQGIAGACVPLPLGTGITAAQAEIAVAPNSRNAGDFPLSDTGASITAADAALGSAPGVIVVAGSLAGTTVTTSPTISANHTLQILVPLTWGPAAFPTLASGSRILGSGALAPQTIQSTGPFVTATAVSNIEIGNLNATWATALGADNGNKLLKCLACNTVYVHDNVTVKGGWILTTSATDTYSSTTLGTNTSSHITLVNNHADGVTGPCLSSSDVSANCTVSGLNIYSAFYKFTQFVDERGSICLNLNTCSFGWGGNNNATTDSAPGDWTSMNPSTLKATDFLHTGLVCTNVQACHVWSMVNRVVASGMIDNGCNDVCEDPEGSQNVQVSAFDLTGAKNGELSSFAHGANIIFGPGKVNHTSEVSWFADTPSIPKSYSLYLRNGYNNPSYLSNILVTGVTFDCNRADGLVCYGVTWDSGYQVKFTNSTFHNTPVYSGMTTSGELPGAEFTSNVFSLDIPSAASQQNPTGSSNPAYYALDLSTHYLDRSFVHNNRFSSQGSQYGGSAALYKGDYLNGNYNGETMALDAQGNTFQGWGISQILTQAGANSSSVTPKYHTALNDYGTGAVLLAANGVTTDYWIEEKEAKDRGTQALTSGTATVTLNGYYLVPPICTANDATATAPARCAVSVSNGTATLTLTGTGTDVISYSVQRKN